MSDVQATICDEKKCANHAVLSVVYEDPQKIGKVKRRDFCHAHISIARHWLEKIDKHVHE